MGRGPTNTPLRVFLTPRRPRISGVTGRPPGLERGTVHCMSATVYRFYGLSPDPYSPCTVPARPLSRQENMNKREIRPTTRGALLIRSPSGGHEFDHATKTMVPRRESRLQGPAQEATAAAEPLAVVLAELEEQAALVEEENGMGQPWDTPRQGGPRGFFPQQQQFIPYHVIHHVVAYTMSCDTVPYHATPSHHVDTSIRVSVCALHTTALIITSLHVMP